MTRRILAALLAVLLGAGTVMGRMDDTEINLALSAEILSTRNARVFPGSELRTTPLNLGDSELVVGWKESVPDKWPMLQAALELYTWPTHMLDGTHSRFVDDPEIDGVPYPGRWRQATISRVRRETRDGEEWWIILTLRSGYATAINWDEGRLTEYRRSESVTTALGTNVVANTTGEDPVQYAIVRFPNLSPYKINACIASLNADSYSNQVVYGETLSGSWYNVMVTGGKAEDGSGYVDLVLSRQRFTIAGYDFYGTIRQANVYRIFSVPKTAAQTIMNAWKGEGRSASADYSAGTELCTLTLNDRNAVKDNLTTAWIWTACDASFRENFVWGYTKAELTTWINGFSNAPAIPPLTRTLSVNERGDGLFNAIMSERTFAAVDGNDPQVVTTNWIGTAISVGRHYGYNYNVTQINAAALQNKYNASVKAIGMSVDFRVTREDDCSFDWVAEIRKQSADILGDITTGSGGVWRRNYSMKGATSNEVTTLESSLKSGPRTNVTVDIDMRDDELADVRAGVVVVQPNSATFSSGTNGVRVDLVVGANMDSVPAAILSGKRIRVQPQITPQDDGTYSYAVAKTEVQDTTNLYTSGNSGVVVRVYSGVNADPTSVPSVQSGPRVRVDPSVQPQDDGTVNYGIARTEVRANAVSFISGSSGLVVRAYAGANADTGDVPAVASSRLTRVNPTLRPNDDGTVDYSIDATTIRETNASWVVGSRGAVTTIAAGNNKASLTDPGVDASTAKGAQVELVAVGWDDAGNMQYQLRTTQRNAQTNSVTGGTLARTVTVASGTGDTTGPENRTPTKGVSWEHDLRTNPDGTTEWTLRKLETGIGLIATITTARLQPGWQAGGYSESSQVFLYRDAVPTFGGRYGYFSRLILNEDGTYSGECITITYTNKTFYEGAVSASAVHYVVNAVDWDWQYYGISHTNYNLTQKRKIYIKISYDVTVDWHDTYAAAIAAISGGSQQSNIELVHFGGTMKWKSTKYSAEPTASGDWTSIGGWVDHKFEFTE